MNKVEQKQFAGSKVIVRACQMVDARKVTQAAKRGPKREQARALGKYDETIDNLVEAVDKLRATEQEH